MHGIAGGGECILQRGTIIICSAGGGVTKWRRWFIASTSSATEGARLKAQGARILFVSLRIPMSRDEKSLRFLASVEIEAKWREVHIPNKVMDLFKIATPPKRRLAMTRCHKFSEHLISKIMTQECIRSKWQRQVAETLNLKGYDKEELRHSLPSRWEQKNGSLPWDKVCNTKIVFAFFCLIY